MNRSDFDPVTVFLGMVCAISLTICVLNNLSYLVQMARDIPALLTGAW